MLDVASWVDHVQAFPAGESATAAASACFRLGDLCLRLDSEPESFLAAFRAQWADCVVAQPLADLPVLRCSARARPGSSLLTLSFSGDAIPDMLEASGTPVRMLRHLARYQPQEGPAPGWRMLAERGESPRVLAAAGGDRLVIDLDEAPPEFAIDALLAIVQAAQPRLLFLHAASLDIAGAGALLIGAAQAGKSTTALALAARGHPLYGDDMAAIRADSGELLPLRRTLRLRPGPSAAAIGPRLRDVPHTCIVDPSGTPRTLVRAGELFAPLAGHALALRFAFVLDGFAAQPGLTRFNPDIAAVQSLKGVVSESVPAWARSPGRDLMKFLTVVHVLSRLACYRLRLGTPEASAAAIETLVMEATCNST